LCGCHKEPEIPNINVFEFESGVTSDLYSVCFSDQEDGYIGGEDGLLLKTVDAGKVWTIEMYPDSSKKDVVGIYFSSKSMGIIELNDFNSYSVDDAKFLFTYNSGMTWIHCDSLDESDTIYYKIIKEQYRRTYPHKGAYYYSPDLGFEVISDEGVNYNGLIYVYEDMELYQTVNTGVTYPLYGLYFVDDYNGYAVGQKSLLKTSNGGLYWEWLRNQTGINISKNLYGVYCFNSSMGFAVGEGGTVIKFNE